MFTPYANAKELCQLAESLSLQDGKLVIFSGTPGAGKSSIALEVRRRGGSAFEPLPRITYRQPRSSDAQEGIRTVTEGSFQQIATTGAYILGWPPGISPSLYPIGEIYAKVKLGKTFVGDAVPDAVGEFKLMFGEHVHAIAILTDEKAIEANIREHLKQEQDLLGDLGTNIEKLILERVSHGLELQAQIVGCLNTYDLVIHNNAKREKEDFIRDVLNKLRERGVFSRSGKKGKATERA